jgi:hypothetical protein
MMLNPMLASVDVRRAPGGLQLTMTAPGNSSTWMIRLRYDQAEELSTALRSDTPAFLGGTKTAALAYIPHYPEVAEGTLARLDGEITDDLCNATYQVRSGLDALRGLGDTLRAHMPDLLEPLPDDPAVPWTPTSVD